MRTFHVVPLEALGDYPDGKPHEDVRDLVASLAVRRQLNPGSLDIAVLSGRPSSEASKVEAWMADAGLEGADLQLVHRDDTFSEAEPSGFQTRWVRQALRSGGQDINKVVFYSPRSEVLEEVASFVASLPREIEFEGIHVQPGSVRRWFA